MQDDEIRPGSPRVGRPRITVRVQTTSHRRREGPPVVAGEYEVSMAAASTRSRWRICSPRSRTTTITARRSPSTNGHWQRRAVYRGDQAVNGVRRLNVIGGVGTATRHAGERTLPSPSAPNRSPSMSIADCPSGTVVILSPSRTPGSSRGSALTSDVPPTNTWIRDSTKREEPAIESMNGD